MRVRYQMVGRDIQAKCDMEEWMARKFYKNMFSNGLCKWAELVGEEDNNYMDVLESFDHTNIANAFGEILGVI